MIRTPLILFFAVLTAYLSPYSMAQDNAPPRVQGYLSVNNLIVADGFTIDVFARRLGDISALDVDERGRFIIADASRGRIVTIEDRARDGQSDMTRTGSNLFDAPTGIAVSGEVIYFSDRQGLWTLSPDGSASSLASYANAGPTTGHHPIRMRTNGSIDLMMRTKDGISRHLLVDTQTGQAKLVDQSDATFLGFAHGSNAPDWILSQTSDGVRLGPRLGQGLKLPDDSTSVWIDGKESRVIFTTPDGVFSAGATLGRLSSEPEPILTGFRSESRGVVRGHPMALWQDDRGLFVADSVNGAIWRVSPKETETILSEEAPL